MSADNPTPLPADLPPVLRAHVHELKANWGWFLALGVLLVVAGTAALVLSVLAGLLTVVALGCFALVASGTGVASAIWSRRWEGTILHLLTAVLYGVFGFLALTKPAQVEAALTLIIAVVFLVNGLSRVTFAVVVRFHHWGWAAFSGLVSVLLGMLIWQEWPNSGLWVIGTFVGIDLLMVGWTWVALAFSLRNLP